MLKVLLVIGLLLSVVFISGCMQDLTETGTAYSGEQIETMAADMIEQEMEEAIEDITLEDIENSIIE
jgi:outer membrane lipoprotein-sorting protein